MFCHLSTNTKCKKHNNMQMKLNYYKIVSHKAAKKHCRRAVLWENLTSVHSYRRLNNDYSSVKQKHRCMTNDIEKLSAIK
jgi:hypothetical protein